MDNQSFCASWPIAIFAIWLSLTLAPFARAVGSEGMPILVYHRFDSARAGPTTVTLAAFQSQLTWLSQHGYRIIPLRQAAVALGQIPAYAQGLRAAITVDDGHESVYTVLFPLIRKAQIPVTLFIYPSAISNAPYALTWAQLREMQASGLVDVESHTYWHPNFQAEQRRLAPRDYEAFVDAQLVRSKVMLEKQLTKPIDQLAWPFGIVDPHLEAAARRAGYAVAFSYSGGPARAGDDLLALPRIPIVDADRGSRFGARIVGRNPEKSKT